MTVRTTPWAHGTSAAHIEGYAVAGIGPKQGAAAPSVWTTFIA